jgi:hypothetical protein
VTGACRHFAKWVMRVAHYWLPSLRNLRNQANFSIHAYNFVMVHMLSQLYHVLVDVILPNLKEIHANQVEQRKQTEELNRGLEEFRGEMQVRFAELRAELAACRTQMEDAIVTLSESEAANADDTFPRDKKNLIH